MSLRDYFATVAMGELGGYYTAARPANKTSQKHARQIAMHAYCLADAMLAERAEAPEGETPA